MAALRMTTASRDIVVADPCAQTNPPLVVAALRAGALGVLDLDPTDPDPGAAADALAEVTRRTSAPFAVRLAWTGAAPRHLRRTGPTSPTSPTNMSHPDG